ncbi:MAG: hypothetical protein IT426_13905 [Pirellulales bacterium]|nr:hypothetical protein [Pirellulales bacterium]
MQFAICNNQFAISPSPANSPRLAVDDPVRSGRDSLDRWFVHPWYDSSADDLRRVDVPVPWKPWSFNFRWGQFLQWFAWVALCAVILFLMYYAAKTYFRREAGAAGGESPKTDASARDRIESLPFPILAGNMNLLDEARRLYQQGDYAKAVVFLFSYQLVELDKRHRIRLAKGKTNRQYLREVGARLSLRQLLEQTMIAFEDTFFGRHALSQTRFESCWFRLGEFEKLNAEG